MHQSIINPSVRLYVGPRAVVRTHKVGKLRIALCTRTLVLRWRHSSQHEKIVQSACTILHNIILILNNMNKSWCTLWYLVVWFAEEFSVSGQDVQQHRRPLQDLRSPSRPLQWAFDAFGEALSNWLRFFRGGGKSCLSQSCSPDASRFNWKQRGSEDLRSIFIYYCNLFVTCFHNKRGLERS